MIEKQSAEDGKGAPPVCAPPPPLRMRSAGPGKPEDMLSPWPGPPRRRRREQKALTRTSKKEVFSDYGSRYVSLHLAQLAE